MPYIIDSITAETLNVNLELLVDGQGVPMPSYNNIGNSSENTEIDWSNGIIQELNLDNDPTLTFSNGLLGQTSTLLLKQNLLGQRNITWPGNVLWSSGVTPTLMNLQNSVNPGNIDTTFNIGSGFDGSVVNLKTQSDDKIIAVGSFSDYNGFLRNRIIRLNSDGSIDNTFNIGTGLNGFVEPLHIQLDGKILVGGGFTSYDGNSRNRIVRLNSDGSIDNTFNIGTGFNDNCVSIVTQLDGKILVGGGFTSYDGNSRNRIVRLNSDGSIDNTFSIGAGFNDYVYSIDIQLDGKIIVGGEFTSYSGISRNKIVRLNSDGSIDNTFNIGTGFNGYVYSIKIQSDGKILVGGNFTSYDGNSRNRIVRLNSDGSIDNSFNIGTGFNNGINTISIQSDGKILCGGSFTSYNGNSRNRIVRLNSDGSINNTFSIGTGFDSDVNSLSIQSDGKILVGGGFTSYNGNSRNFIVRLQYNSEPPATSYNKVEFDYNGIYYIGSY
jgi:uncharacterized delta-60 repeat protein